MTDQCDQEGCAEKATIDVKVLLTYTDGKPPATLTKQYCQTHALEVLATTFPKAFRE